MKAQQILIEETAQKFFKLIEAGDLAFYKIIRFGLGVFGRTKVGKTTLCHHLIKNPLIGYKKTSQILYKTNTDKDSSALIGNTTDSQTQIPNQFTSNIIMSKKQQNPQCKLEIIDTPGYSDTYGINRVLSNAFFHYRVYSKVQNMKFLLVFDSSQTKSPFNHFEDTMKNYFKTFKNYDQIQSQLLDATAIMITKVKQNKQSKQQLISQNQQILRSAVTAILKRQSFKQYKWQQPLKRFLLNMLENKKIFVFTQAQENISAEDNSLLQEINKKTKFYTRQIVPKENTIDMSQINFSAANQIKSQTKDQMKFQKAKKILDQFKKKSIQTIKVLITFLRHVQIQALEAINSENAGNFQELSLLVNKQQSQLIKLLKVEVKQNYQFLVDQRYNQNRLNIKDLIKAQYKAFDQQHQKIWTTSLQVTHLIVKFMIRYQDYKQYNFNDLKKFKEEIWNILKWICLFFNEKNKEIIHKYHYCIHRFFEEVYIMLLIANKSDSKIVDSDNPMLKIIDVFSTIPNKINQDFFIKMEEYPKFSLVLHNLDNFIVNFLQNNGDLITQSRLKESQIINFTNQFILSEKCKIELNLMKVNKIQRQLEKLWHKQLKKKELCMINTLIQYVNYLKDKRKLMKFKDYQNIKEKFLQIEIFSWNSLGKMLMKTNSQTCFQDEKNYFVIEIFKLTLNTIEIVKIYQRIIKKMEDENIKEFNYNNKDKNNQDQQIQIYLRKRQENIQKIIEKRIQFAQFLSSVGKSAYALDILQTTYCLIKKNYQQRKKVSELIAVISLGKDRPISQNSQKYYSKMANKEFISNPSKKLSKYLQELRKQNEKLGTIFDPTYDEMKQQRQEDSPLKKVQSNNSNNKISNNQPIATSKNSL